MTPERGPDGGAFGNPGVVPRAPRRETLSSPVSAKARIVPCLVKRGEMEEKRSTDIEESSKPREAGEVRVGMMGQEGARPAGRDKR